MARQFRGRRGYSWSGAVWDWAGVGFWMGSEGRLGIGDWELGMDEPDQESRAPGEWTADSGIKRVEQGTGGPGPGGRWRTGRRASNGEGGSGVFNAMCGRRTRKCDNQENKHPEIPRFSGKQSATTTTTETRLRHSMCYFRAGALGMVSPRFSPLKKREGVSPLQLLLLEVPLLSSSSSSSIATGPIHHHRPSPPPQC